MNSVLIMTKPRIKPEILNTKRKYYQFAKASDPNQHA